MEPTNWMPVHPIPYKGIYWDTEKRQDKRLRDYMQELYYKLAKI